MTARNPSLPESSRTSWAAVRVKGGKLVLGEARGEQVPRPVHGHGFAQDARPGDWVSLQWGRACEVLTERERAHLERYTRRHLAFANLRL
jgi:hypothetical protein